MRRKNKGTFKITKALGGANHQEIFIMGRDPVEHASVRKRQPPAMRVRIDGYTKKSPFNIQ